MKKEEKQDWKQKIIIIKAIEKSTNYISPVLFKKKQALNFLKK